MTTSEMTETSRLPVLSPDTVARLKSLKDTDKPALYRLVASLRKNNWPLRAIATPLNVSRSIVAIWETKAEGELPESEGLPPALPKKMRPVYVPYTIDPEDAKHMYRLARDASKVRRFTDLNSPYRLAAEELEDLLHKHKRKGASLAQLAQVCGVTRRAIAQRLEKANH